jgi:hypothetical protein
VSIFSKLFGAKREDEGSENKGLDSERELYSNGSDSAAKKEITEPAAIIPPAATDEIARRVSNGLRDLAGTLKVISEQVALQRATSETLSKTSRRQIEVLEELDRKLGKVAEAAGDSPTLTSVGESLKEEIKLLSNLDRSANETNAKLTATLEVITDALKTLPVTEARQTEVMEGIREHLRESADLQAVLQEISERSRTQSQHVAALEKDVREGLTRLRKSESRRMRTSNIILFLILIAVLVMGIAALGSLSRISGPSNTATGAAP